MKGLRALIQVLEENQNHVPAGSPAGGQFAKGGGGSKSGIAPSEHGLLSPSGRISKGAEKAAKDRLAKELFPPGFWDRKQGPPTKVEQIEYLHRQAGQLRGLASRGMKPRAYTKKADEYEAAANELAGK